MVYIVIYMIVFLKDVSIGLLQLKSFIDLVYNDIRTG